MSQQVKVYRDLQFVGNAQNTDNVEGNISFEKVVLYEDFLGKAIDNTNDFTVTMATGSATITSPHCMRMATTAVDDDEGAVATELCIDRDNNPVLEVRARNNDVSDLAHFIGFSDAQSETGQIPLSYNGGSFVSTATDAAGFVVDNSQSDLSVICASVNNDTDGTEHDSGVDDSDGTFHVYRITLDGDGNATYWIDGSKVAYEAAAVADVSLCAVIGIQSIGGAIDNLDVDYIKLWMDR